MSNTQLQRKPRFKRDQNVNFRLTERDLEIIRLVYAHRFLSSEHVLALMEGSKQVILRRLNLLFHAGYLDRPRVQLTRIGNRPMVYGLGNKGADLLAAELDLSLGTVDWTSKNRELKAVFLDHTLMVAEFLIIVTLACKNTAGVEFIPAEEIVDRRPVLPKVQEKALSWRVETAGSRGKKFIFSVIPDSVFGLRFTGKGKANTSYFFVEADRSSMPIRRSNLLRSSFYKKMFGYWHTWQQKLFAKNFGFKNPRILTLTLSEQRIKSMIDANKKVDQRGKGLRMFLFATEKAFTLEDPESVFKKAWTNGRGEKASIIE